MTGAELKKFRIYNGWSQLTLARKTGISLGTICRWEKGTCVPMELTVAKFNQWHEKNEHRQA